MALVTKMTRCALCGSSDVIYSKADARYHCVACGANGAHPMPAADLERINRIAVLGGSDDELAALRRRYPRLELANWSSENRLQLK